MRRPISDPPRRSRDEGAALLITMLVLVVVMILGTTVLTVTVNDLGAAKRSQDAAGSLDAADAGVTQALTYLRRNGGRGVLCSPSCPANAWGNSTTPVTVALPGSTDQRYRVWIQPVPPTNPTFYRVHSIGSSSRGKREVQVDVQLSLLSMNLPLGVFARTITGGGTADVTRESVYTTGCVYNRSKIGTTGTDPVTGLPAAVHSARIITDSNGSNPTCSSDKKAIHSSTGCNTSYPYDHDSIGASWTKGSACGSALSQSLYDKYYAQRDLDGDGASDVAGSFLRDAASLRKVFSIDDDPFQDSELQSLKEVARQQGTYFTTSTVSQQPTAAQAVVYFDFSASPGQVVDLKDITTHLRASTASLSASDPLCRQESLLVVVDQGNLRFNGNPNLAASLVLVSKAPYGEVLKANGTAGLIGTIFSDKLNLVGTFDSTIDPCFIANLSPSIYDVTVSDYLEVDR